VYSSGFDRHLTVFCNEFSGCGISILPPGGTRGRATRIADFMVMDWTTARVRPGPDRRLAAPPLDGSDEC